MEMPQSSPPQFDAHIPPPTNHTTSYQIGMVPPASQFLDHSYQRDHKTIQIPFHDGANSYERPCYFYHWQVPHVEYITDIQPNDVLSGRGGATNSHSGNRAFRSLVKQYQSDYLRAKKRDKPQVAAIVVDKIREKGGRFLRRYTTKSEGVFWVDIGDVRAREKTCQALREGAPEIRRRKAAFHKDGSTKFKDSDGSISIGSTYGRTESDDDKPLSNVCRTEILRTSFEIEKKEAISIAGALTVIRPSMTLLCGDPSDAELAIPIDHLDIREREIYLRDFLPPNPSVQKKKLKLQAIPTPANKNDNGIDEW
eukprot:CAMPEP_0197174084 /NCGR_PEP_ID=MMETSP1423-20130617/761_1 /TAXON_ID=476441 /ORGANISM="Pseudo-nitzschia heimii, Strain UNC1101" /LENGTH=309 /DNA_ID=CAMNT_0042622979 /DNA_START=511 /DNA_END=1437 /DNA_ORIENTATION=+